ncbi:MAG: RnfABCDGE type electron transport complex subunit D [Treponemataceae bacterium]|nr:RnfABCDGE type electron transport complex subunit D [Spirochaetales bacterium]MDY6031866.1 RnfABCDGE type electron transport complex subunit D [Treponemataceae bacterium]
MKKTFRNLRLSPFLYLTPSLTHISLAIFGLLLPQIVMLFVTKSYSNLLRILISIVASYLAEILSNKIRHTNTLLDFTALVQGLMIGMFIPSNYPLITVFFFTFISLLLSKHIFGGTGATWINPVAFTVVFFYLLGMSFFPETMITKALLEGGQPGLDLINSGCFDLISLDSKITFALNTHFFSHLGIEVPNGYISLLWDSGSPIPAFRFNFLTLLASIILISFDMINWIAPAVYLFVYALFVLLFSQVAFTGKFAHGDVLFSILTSGTLFTAFFMVDSYGTTPQSLGGKIIYGAIAGIFCFLICGCGTSSIGNMFTILICNIISPIIQYFEDRIYIFKVNKNMRKNNYA